MRAAREQGFTLIELMIAMTILAFISLGVYDITSSTFARRETIESEGDFYNTLRVGLEVFGRDISQLYSPMADALPGDLGKAPQTPNGTLQGGNANDLPLGQPTEFWGEPINKEGIRPSRFQGEQTKMSFVSSSHVRIYRDAAESELVKISYNLEDMKVPDPRNPGRVIMKTEDVAVFEDDDRRRSTDEEPQKFALMTGVKSVEFKYYDGEKDTWHDRWDTSGADHKGVYPTIVKVTVEVYMPNSTENTFKAVQQFRPELPL